MPTPADAIFLDRHASGSRGPNHPEEKITMQIDPRRHLEIEGTHNVRDLGGYETQDGRLTQWRRFLRADSLFDLPVASQQMLLDLDLRTVVDLRRGSELETAPSVFADSTELAYHHLDMIGEDPLEPFPAAAIEGADRYAQRTAGSYWLWLDRRQSSVRQILSVLAAPDALPALFNCAAGKDRTGCTAALLLGLAGVPDEVIAADYALSARFRVGIHLEELASKGERPDGYTWKDFRDEFVPDEAMSLVLRHLQQQYGGVEAYVRAIGLDAGQVDSLRAGLLDAD